MNLDADFATWDIQANGGHLAFSQGDLIVAPEVFGTDAHRSVRSTFAARAGAISTVEFIIWSPDGSNPSLVPAGGIPPLVVGYGTEAAALNEWVGFDNAAISYCPGDGGVRQNNTVLDTIATATFGDKIRMTIDNTDTANPVLYISKNTQPIGTFDLDPNQAYFYMGTVSGNPGSIMLMGNSGAVPQYYGTSDGGFWQPIDHIAPILLATEPHMSASTDTPRHEKYDGNLEEAGRPLSISEGASFWMDGPSAPSELGQGGLVQMQVNDPLASESIPNVYAPLCDDMARGTLVEIGRNEFDGALTGEESQYCGVLDHAEPDSLQTIQLYARDITSLLDKPLRRAQFMPDTENPGAVAQPLMINEGIDRNYEGVIVDKDGKKIVLNDGAITAFGICRMAGVPMIYGTDFAIGDDGASVTLLKDPTGKVTFESTSFGGAFDSTVADYFNGAGDFTTATAATHPPDALVDVGYPKAAGVQWHGNYFLAKGKPFSLKGTGTDKYIESKNDSYGYAWIYQSDTKVRAGYTYIVSIDVRAIPYYGNAVLVEGGTPVNEPPARLYLTWIKGTNGEFGNWVEIHLDHVGNYEAFFTNNTGADQDLVLFFASNGIISTTEVLQISKVTPIEQPLVGQVEELDGPGLTQMVSAFAVKRGPLETYQVSTADTDAIDAATGYKYGLHVPETDNPTARDCLQQLANSSNSAMYGDPKFALRFLYLSKPEDTDDGDVIELLTRSDLVDGELIQIPDFAENLRARAQGRPNISPDTQSDFTNATLVQVPALTRDQLSRAYQWTVTTGIKLADRYRGALLRDPWPTLLDRPEHGQHFIDHACDPFSDNRNFYRGTFWMPFGRNFQIGQVYTVRHPNVTGGEQKLILRGYSPKQPNSKRPTCRCIFWGL